MIVIVIPYYSEDRRAAIELAEIIAAIEPERRNDVRVRFVNRSDAESMPLPTVQAVGKKFDVSWDSSKVKHTGWPSGPNAMAIDILTGAPRWLANAGWSDATGILIMEPDCVPLRKDWLNVLLGRWANACESGVWQMGAWCASGGPQGHINGNCVLRPDIARKIDLKTWCPPSLAWDVGIAPFAKKHWRPTRMIANHFDSRNATAEKLIIENGQMPAFVHGYKDDSARLLARKLLLS